MRILIVDDDERIRVALADPLRASGYEVMDAADGEDALLTVESWRPDLLILDLTLPGMSGFDVCRELRRWEELSGLPRTPVIFLTVRDDFESEETGFGSGGDDYVTKPFSIPALLSRVRLRLPNTAERVIDGYLRLNLTTRDVAVRDGDGWQAVRLQPLEFALLERLYLNAGIWISRSDLLEQVFGREDEDTKAVEKYVHLLRQKLEPDPKEPVYIQSMRNVGYRFKPTSVPMSLDRTG